MSGRAARNQLLTIRDRGRTKRADDPARVLCVRFASWVFASVRTGSLVFASVRLVLVEVRRSSTQVQLVLSQAQLKLTRV